MKLYELLVLETQNASPRSEAIGWSFEDPSLIKAGPIGLSPSGMMPEHHYDCPMRALADGWRLLGPPQLQSTGKNAVAWVWYLERETS